MAEKKEDKRKQYFIAVIPQSPYFEEALALKQYFYERYNSKGALRSPPHITLHMPFRWKEEKERELAVALQDFALQCASFRAAFNNFGCFSPRVIFIDIQLSEELAKLQMNLHRFLKQELNLFNANYKEQHFHPHLTVAFRDLKKTAFHEAWEEFKDKKFEGEFLVDRIVLLKHNGEVWEVFREFSMNVQASTRQ
jgi:2'-5' RNA ligase